MNFQFTKLPKKLSIDLCRSNLTSREIRVLLFVVEKTLGWQKKDACLRQIDISEATNIHSSHISKTIKSLASKGYVNAKKEKYGVYLEVDEKWLEESSGGFKSKPNRISKIAKLDTSTYPSQPSQVGYVEMTATPIQELKAPSPKEIKKETIKENLSFKSKTLEDYFSNILAPKKQKKEREAYFSLVSNGISEEDISKGLRFLQERGIPGSNKSAYLPLCWLTVGIDDLLPRLKKNTQPKLSTPPPIKQKPNNSKPSDFELAKIHFESSYCSDAERALWMKQIIEDFRKENESKFGGGFRFSGAIAERLGLISWHKKQVQMGMEVAS